MSKTFERIEIVLEPENKFDSGLLVLRIKVRQGRIETGSNSLMDINHFESLFDRVLAKGVEELKHQLGLSQ